jgi:hypothetical protein
VIDRDVGDALFELADGIAARGHHFAHQPVGFRD